MGDLEQIDPGQPAIQQRRVHLFLHVAGQQEPALADHAQEHDRHVVDAAAGIGRFFGDLAPHRPEHAHRDLIDRQPVTGPDRHPRRRSGSGKLLEPGRVARSGPTHPGFQDTVDAVPVQQQRQARDVILVRMRQHDSVDPPVPWRDPSIELDQEPIGIGPAVDQQSPAARAFDEDRVALADVEDRDPRHARRTADRDGAGGRHRDDEAEGRRAARP